MKMSGEIRKKDEDLRQVFGWASVAEVTDSQGDVIPEAELEKAAYDFVINSRTGGEMHEVRGVATLIESMMFTKEKQSLLGIDVPVGWWVGFKVTDESVWAKIKSGEYKMFSIGGRARRITNG